MSAHITSRPLPGEMRPGLIASVTSTEPRLHVVAFAIESILLQSIRPESVHLYLSDGIDLASLPLALGRLQPLGLVIHSVPDVGPHTKLFYALQQFPAAHILTFDDDIYYPPNTVETMLRTAQAAPGAIVGNWVRKLRRGPSGAVLGARRGRLMTPKLLARELEPPARSTVVGFDLFAYGTGAVLYPPNCMDTRVFDVETMQAICPTEDDVWFKAMSLLKGVPVATSYLGHTPRHHSLRGSQAVALRHRNHGSLRSRSASQIRAAFSHFDLYGRLRELQRNG